MTAMGSERSNVETFLEILGELMVESRCKKKKKKIQVQNQYLYSHFTFHSLLNKFGSVPVGLSVCRSVRISLLQS